MESALTAVFLFIDMFALTTLYCILFFYIRLQLKNFRKAASTSELHSSHELQSWQANLEAGVTQIVTAPKQIITTKTVTVTTEERPNPRRPQSDAERAHRRMNQVALTLLCYPIMYICLTMPLSITRISEFAGKEWTLPGIYAGASIYCCSGFMNVLLYTLTRKGIISWDWLFGKRKEPEQNVQSPPPPYNPLYPGTHNGHSKSDSSIHIPQVVVNKPSAISISSLHHSSSVHSQSKSLAEQTVEDSASQSELMWPKSDLFSTSSTNGDKFIHLETGSHNPEGDSYRTSNGSTLVGS
jgi:hypothetical protein